MEDVQEIKVKEGARNDPEELAFRSHNTMLEDIDWFYVTKKAYLTEVIEHMNYQLDSFRCLREANGESLGPFLPINITTKDIEVGEQAPDTLFNRKLGHAVIRDEHGDGLHLNRVLNAYYRL